MSIVQIRGGIPDVFRESIDTTGRIHSFGFWINYLTIRVLTFPCRMYFTEADFDANENFVALPVAAAENPHGEWHGPVEANQVWLRGVGGTAAVEMVGFQRRG